MKIGIDASRAVNEKAGVGKYTYNLIKNLQQNYPDDQFSLLFNFWRDYESKCVEANNFLTKNTQLVLKRFPGPLKEKLLKSKIGYTRHVLKNIDVFLAPTFLDVDLSMKTPQVVVIHDLSMFYYPEYFAGDLGERFKKYTELACKKATRIIAVSESTKKDIIKFLGTPEEKISVIYPGLIRFKQIAPKLPDGLQKQNYILCVGTVEPRKNLVNLLKAYKILQPELRQKFPLIIVGAKGWRDSEIFKEFKKSKLEDEVKFMGYVDDEMLGRLYKDASLFIYPSLYEGFGLPVTEAMQFGTPVITSDLSSLPEAAGVAGLLVNPSNPKEIALEMQKVLTGQFGKKKLMQLGIKQADKFSWKNAARETMDLLRDLFDKS